MHMRQSTCYLRRTMNCGIKKLNSEVNARLLGIIEEMKKSFAGSEPISDISTKREKRKAHTINEWISCIEAEGIQVIQEVY